MKNRPQVDFDPPLPSYVGNMIQVAARNARKNFDAGKSLPFLTQVAPETTTLVVTPLRGKEEYAELARMALLAGCAVVLAAEVWLLEGQDVKLIGTGHPPVPMSFTS